HRGEFVEHDVAGESELLGADVILAHRLMKNSVTADHGLRAYALVSEACREMLELPVGRQHVESFGDVGEVRCTVLDLDSAWQAEQSERRVVARADAPILFEA